MKIVFYISLLCALNFQTAVQADTLPSPKVQKLSDKVYVLLGPNDLPNKANQGYIVNATLILGDKGAMLVDTGFNDVVGKHIKQTIATLTPKPVTYIINTHHHGDHVLGNIAFPKAQVLSTQACKTLVEKTGYEWIDLIQNIAGKKFPNTRPVLATETVAQDLRAERVIDGVKLVLWAPKGSHTPGDLMVLLPDEKILIAGDVLVNQVVPNFRDAHIKTWISTLQSLQKSGAQTFVPGHGPVMTLADVTAMEKRMSKLYAGVEAGYKKGLNDAEVRKTLDLSEWKKLKLFDEQMGENINRTYLEVEAANF